MQFLPPASAAPTRKDVTATRQCDRRIGRTGFGGERVLVPSYYPMVSTSIKLTNAHPDCPSLRERAVNPTPATVPLASAPPTAKTIAPANTIENYVGQRVSAVAAILLEALAERQDGGLTSSTKMRGGDLLAALHGLRLFMIADWPFDEICRVHGAAALRAADVSSAHADVLVDEVLNLLHKIARTAAN